ncbi:cold-regulated protein 27 [Lactuca sativa]|uniref:cold-regulated protein 27 n=1 Tax=Lactuca sativa TaxID=4236 RepID=UPI000CD864C0|nr:cold-regulated protein 27 [Lactuca sativa]
MTGNVLLSEFVEQEESSIMESQKKESSEWTNEKHSLYLKSIEASFVDQLYNSLDLQSYQTQKTSSSKTISFWKNHTNAPRIPSGQFKVHQGGCWTKKKFMKENPQLKDSERSHVSLTNPWIQHFTNGNRHGAMTSASPSIHETLSSSSTETSQQNPVPESDSNTEMTDQNFVEDLSIKKTNTKRKRTTTVANSSNDQVVPFCTSPTNAKNKDL